MSGFMEFSYNGLIMVFDQNDFEHAKELWEQFDAVLWVYA